MRRREVTCGLVLSSLAALAVGQQFIPAPATSFPVIGSIPGIYPEPEPKEACQTGTDQCISRSSSYKCGIFIENMPGETTPFFMAGLPDILRRVKGAKNQVEDDPEIQSTFGQPGKKLLFRHFIFPKKIRNKRCADDNLRFTNSRCSVLLNKASTLPLDSCSRSTLNTERGSTIGSSICKVVFANIGITDKSYRFRLTYKYSLCGRPWSPVLIDIDKGLVKKQSEDLCCTLLNGKATFQRCDGSPTVTQCPQVA